MKFEKQVCYITDGNTHHGAGLKASGAVNMFISAEGECRWFNQNLRAKVRKCSPTIAFKEEQVDGFTSYVPYNIQYDYELDDAYTVEDIRPNEYEYVITETMDILIYECVELRTTYDLWCMTAEYTFRNVLNPTDEVRNYLNSLIDDDGIIEISDLDFENIIDSNSADVLPDNNYVYGYELFKGIDELYQFAVKIIDREMK